MHIKSILNLAGCCAALLSLPSCGGTNPGPAVATFKTVTVTASALAPELPSKVFAGGACSNGVLTGATIIEDVPLSVTLTSTLYPVSSTASTTTVTGQPVTINGFTVSYFPTNGGPPISDPARGGFTGTLLPGGTLLVPVPVTSDTTKALLQNDPILQKCTAHNYDYIATITFYGTELGGTNANIVASTTVSYTNIP